MGLMQAVLLEPVKAILAQLGNIVLKVIGVLIILLFGWWVAKGVKALVTRILRLVDNLSDSVGINAILEKGGIKYPLSELIGIMCYWLMILVAIVVAVNAIGLTIAADLLNRIILYVPNVIAAIFILILGMFVATLLRNIVQTAANNVGLSQVKLLGKIVETVVIVFAVIMALEQLGIAVQMTGITLTIILGSLGLGLALAFGLGCKEIAGKFVADWIEKIKK